MELEYYLRERLPDSALKSEPHINSKLKAWNRSHANISLLKGRSGLGFQYSDATVIVDDVIEWEKFLKMMVKDLIHGLFPDTITIGKDSKDIYDLQILILKCLKAGYIPNTSFVLHEVEEHQKKELLFYHSAKLVVTIGLLMIRPGRPIHIMKNVLLCGDCHTFFKYVSVVTKRDTHIRDASAPSDRAKLLEEEDLIPSALLKFKPIKSSKRISSSSQRCTTYGSIRGAKGAASPSGVQNHTYVLVDRQNLEASPDVVTGTLSIISHDVYVLVNSSSKLSYVTPLVVGKFKRTPELLVKPLEVSTPIGESVKDKRMY
ncbi:Pentatricopeptide repeat-containing protein [Capsicum baccatum]|uniref:Pentatricopeptide repeat-containing protein n=1 Tax=Capsicum baccatum TaxID=33114 RepID=A0A2G2WXU6_CAPBA|nr:Pentatricopeptide repeat-containing protein [Capsicum baccatum]